MRGGLRLFDEFRGTHWTLLTVGAGSGLTDLPDLSGLPGLAAVRTVRIPAYEAYGDGLFLIRPDGYVGWAGTSAAGLTSYAAGIGA